MRTRSMYTMRIILSLEQILSLCNPKISLDTLKTRFENDDTYRKSLAKKYAIKHKLHNGATLEFPEDGYRNHNLLFWDAQNEKIVEPFTKIDDYGSVPPRFVVGDGYFEPFDWLDEVEHNTYVFPAKPLINEMKEFVEQYPTERRMILTINGNEYIVTYDPYKMKGEWDSCILEVHEKNSFSVYPGDPEWRKTIID